MGQDYIKKLFNENIFFVTTDVKRALGLEGLLPNYHIICSIYDPLILLLRNQGAKIFCLEEEQKNGSLSINNTGKLLEHPQVASYISAHSAAKPWIMVFKPSLKIDLIIRKEKYNRLGNNCDLNEKYENKIICNSLLEKQLPELLLPAKISVLNRLNFPNLAREFNLPFVIQFGHGWAGKTTFFIHDEQELNNLTFRYPLTQVKVSKFIKGRTALNNCCIYQGQVYFSAPAIQLNGISELSDNPSVTCGRQWSKRFFPKKEVTDIEKITDEVSELLIKDKYRGFFGLDFLISEETGKIYLNEINARLTASTAFYTKLELGAGKMPLLSLHLAEFLHKSLVISKTGGSEEISGSQVIVRTNLLNDKKFEQEIGLYGISDTGVKYKKSEYFPDKLKKNEFIYIKSRESGKKDAEKVRIETRMEVLENHHKLNRWLLALFNG